MATNLPERHQSPAPFPAPTGSADRVPGEPSSDETLSDCSDANAPRLQSTGPATAAPSPDSNAPPEAIGQESLESFPRAEAPAVRVVLVTGPSGAGRSTAINALEDLGFEAIDNMPLGLLPRLFEGPPPDGPMALGVDARNRDFSAAGLIAANTRLATMPGYAPDLLYLDCATDVLQRRYSETRRRHPLAPEADPAQGIAQEVALLAPVRAAATVLVDTSGLTPHDLRAEITRLFAPERAGRLAITVMSFSYRRGLPTGADLVFDCRFLRNPHWDPGLRRADGRQALVQSYIAADPRFAEFRDRVIGMTDLLLPAFAAEGKSHLTIAFGCTGGQHRSVALTEILSAHLAEAGWPVSKRHREVEQWRAAEPRVTQDMPEASET